MTIALILETDMSKHFTILGTWRSRINLPNFHVNDEDGKLLALKIMLKLADIGHAAKEWDLHYKWSCRVMEELFN